MYFLKANICSFMVWFIFLEVIAYQLKTVISNDLFKETTLKFKGCFNFILFQMQELNSLLRIVKTILIIEEWF